MGCEARYEQLHNVETALGQLERIGYGAGTDPYDKLWKERGAIFGKLGQTRAKQTITVGAVKGRSPGEFRAWFDTEVGWMIEARETPFSDPIIRSVTFELAQKVITNKLTEAEETFLLTPVEYAGEE